MFSRVKKIYLVFLCSGLLTSSQPLAARNNPMIYSGVGITTVAGLYAILNGLGYCVYKAIEKGSFRLKDDTRPIGQYLFKDSFWNRDIMAREIGITPEELDRLTYLEYVQKCMKLNKDPIFGAKNCTEVFRVMKLGCVIGVLGALAGIAMTIKGQ